MIVRFFKKEKEIIQNRKFQGNLDLHVRPPLVSDHLNKRPLTQNTNIFLVKALQLEPLVNDHLL